MHRDACSVQEPGLGPHAPHWALRAPELSNEPPTVHLSNCCCQFVDKEEDRKALSVMRSPGSVSLGPS